MPTTELDATEERAFTRLSTALADTSEFTKVWRDRDDAGENDAVVVVHGAPDPDRMKKVSEGVVGEGLELPRLYLRVISVFNGISVFAAKARPLSELPATRLGEPDIWPIGLHDHDQLADVDLEGIERAFVFGERADSGFFAFDLGADGPSPVFWIPTRFASTPPTRVAASFAAFIDAWVDASLSTPLLLRNARVRGWGG